MQALTDAWISELKISLDLDKLRKLSNDALH